MGNTIRREVMNLGCNLLLDDSLKNRVENRGIRQKT